MARRNAIAGLAIGVIVGIGLILLLVAVRSLSSRGAFGTWDNANHEGLPALISYCDRHYLPGSHRTRNQIDPEGNFPYQEVGAADGKPIFAQPLSESARHTYGNPPLPCDMAVYLQLSEDDYVAYGLSGGP